MARSPDGNLKRLLLHEFVLEVMLANDLAQNDRDTAERVMRQIGSLQGHALQDDAEAQRLAALFVSRVEERIAELHAGISKGPPSQN